MKEILSSNGKTIQLDDRDFARVGDISWKVGIQDRITNTTTTPEGTLTRSLINQLITLEPGEVVLYKDGNPLNLQQSNLVRTERRYRSLMKQKLQGKPVGVKEVNGKYRVQLFTSGTDESGIKYFGTYPTATEAMEIADAAIESLWGTDAPRNNPKVKASAREALLERAENPGRRERNPGRNDEIRQMIEKGATQAQVGAHFQISQSAVSVILRSGSRHASAQKRPNRLSDEQRTKVHQFAEQGMTQSELARAFNISPSTVQNILRDK